MQVFDIINILLLNSPYASDCPITVGRTELRDKNTYFSEVILEKSTGKKRFFDSSLAGFTIQNTSNGLDVRSWFSNQVSKINMLFQP